MKKMLLVFTVLFVATISCIDAQQNSTTSQQAQQPQSPRDTVVGKGVSISYGQPSKRGRKIFGELVPYGKVWRTGANEATEITFDSDVEFGGKQVKAGTYSLFTIPNENEWTIILNSSRKQWGAFEYDKIKDKDVAQVTVPVTKSTEPVEELTMSFDEENTLTIAWDDVKTAVRMKTLSN